MIARVMGVALGTALLLAGATVFGYRGYQAYLRWLVGGEREPTAQPATPSATAMGPGPAGSGLAG